MLTELSFVEAGAAWKPARSGDYAKDCARGRSYGEEFLAFTRDSQSPSALGHIVQGMTLGGTWSGVEVGFCAAIGEALCHH